MCHVRQAYKKDKMRVESNKSSSRAKLERTQFAFHVFTSWLINIFFDKEADASRTANVCKHKVIYTCYKIRQKCFYDLHPQKSAISERVNS